MLDVPNVFLFMFYMFYICWNLCGVLDVALSGSLDLILQYQNPLSQFFDEAKLGGSNSNIYVLYVHPENW